MLARIRRTVVNDIHQGPNYRRKFHGEQPATALDIVMDHPLTNRVRKKSLGFTLVFVVGILAAVAYLVITAARPGPDVTDSASANGAGEVAVVDYVVDGDTINLTIGGVSERVRLIGVDTPETVNRQTPQQCFGAEASAALSELLPEGSTVRIERDAEPRDKFGRLLLYVYRSEDDLLVNKWLIENGYGSAISYRPNVAFKDTFSQAESEARRNEVGLWAVCDGPDQPLDPTS